MADDDHDDAIFHYGDPKISTAHAPIPKWLIWNYVFWIIWGLVWWHTFWNGSLGWFDGGYWAELQRAANTTFPIENVNAP